METTVKHIIRTGKLKGKKLRKISLQTYRDNRRNSRGWRWNGLIYTSETML